MKNEPIAIVGMACRYPDAPSPAELWNNVLAQRKAFRRIPTERLNLDDYWSPDPDAPETTYITQGAFLANYEFDRIRFRISGEAYRASDMAQWLALDVAADALADAGFSDAQGLPQSSTCVYLGNTLTGEISRSLLLRQRWPYVRRVLAAALAADGWPENRVSPFLEKLETQYKEPFPVPGPESLVGGLANTIAGRICNFFDLQGGGYVVDGACASSLLAVAQACSALASGDADAALAGGVDLSIDPFELIGFARVGALAQRQMRVYDKRSAGFLPGEGCGLLVLMRESDALQAGRRIYALIRGWGISSDGAGSMTRPEISGQTLALERAYRRAGIDISAVGYFEGHGTGTEVGDLTELQTIGALRRSRESEPAAIGSIKANIGHTKAAAGAAGLIKATLALDSCILPPTTGCDEPHPELTGDRPALRILREPQPWVAERARYASVSAMGFGGINTHIVLQERAGSHPAPAIHSLGAFAHSPQDAELFAFGAESAPALSARISAFAELARQLSLAEMSDAAASLHASASGPWRAAVVAASPSQLFEKLTAIGGAGHRIDPVNSTYVSSAAHPPRIGLLFPGQAAPVRRAAGALGRRFAVCEQLYPGPGLPAGRDSDTSIAQPAVITASLSALAALEALGISGSLAIGHSLGEMAALAWAGAIDRSAAIRLARVRGEIMMKHCGPGSMASIAAGAEEVEPILPRGVVIAGVNSPRQTVISGDPQAIANATRIARAHGWHVSPLPVSHAFHSPSLCEAAAGFALALSAQQFRPPERPVYSTVSGGLLSPGMDLASLLIRQLTSRVEFQSAVQAAAPHVDVFIEAGPGAILSGLVSENTGVPAVSLDAGSDSFHSLLNVAGAAFALGAPVRLAALFDGRYTKPFEMRRPTFLANPCESAPRTQASVPRAEKPAAASEPLLPKGSAFETVRDLIAQHAQLPAAAVRAEDRLLSDLHLNSIAVVQIVAQAARSLGTPPAAVPPGFANSTVAALADALAGTKQAAMKQEPLPRGLSPWVRCFGVEWTEEKCAAPRARDGSSNWRVMVPAGHPLKDALLQAFSGPGSGVVVCIPPGAADRQATLLLEAAHDLSNQQDRFVVVHHGDGASGFARSLRMEKPQTDVCVIRIPVSPRGCESAYLEAATAQGFAEIWHGDDGVRRAPRLQFVPLDESQRPFLNREDVLLASGGGKGIGAECALALARAGSARLLILGRAAPETDGELARNLDRAARAGIRFEYVRADIADGAAVAAAIQAGERALGPVTAILHAAGRNVPASIASLDLEAIAATVAPKAEGLRNMLAAVCPERLRLLLSFGSIIARMGMQGNADYALANERLRQITDEFAAAHPACRCLTLEWSLWSGAGMGERLGSVESLARQGITPISPEQGTRVLQSILAGSNLPTSLIVASRFKSLPDLPFANPDPPLSRFLERTQLFVPGVELIAEARLSAASDPYLSDHVFERTPLLPAVIGMEAMAQAAAALGNHTGPIVWRDLAFERAITIPPRESTTIRVYANAGSDGTITVCIRTGQTGFETDHFRGALRFEAAAPFERVRTAQHAPETFDAAGLYGAVLFQSGRFQRVERYSFLTSTGCRAHLKCAGENAPRWFGAYHPSTLTLGDPGAHDAAIHAIQACIPERTVVPTSVNEIRVFSRLDAPEFVVEAVERSSGGGTFVYDLDLLDGTGRILEQWRGLVLRGVGSRALQPATEEAAAAVN